MLVIIQSANQLVQAEAKGINKYISFHSKLYRKTVWTNPDQKPKHNEHLKSSSKTLALHKKVRIIFNIEPYFNTKVNPTQESSIRTAVTSFCLLFR